ncbi:MAG: type II secretion system F family protein [Kiritimatiellae bacterium]|nr:type II secretion system F family protein [Kiritimatiellia bacterium]
MAISTTPGSRSRSAATAASAPIRKRRIPGAQKIKAKELPAFTRQMGAMLSAGLPVVQTLEALEEQNTNKVFKHVISGVKSRIEGGASFSEALAQYPDIFDELYISMLRAGESGGMLAETTARIATFLEGWVRLKRKVKSAMMYPVIVMVVALLITSSLIIWIVPIFASIYADFGADLPGPTQWLMNVSTAMRKNAVFVVAGIVVTAIALGQFKKTEKGAFMWDGIKLRLPVVGELVRKISLARFSSTFAQLTRSGVPILQTMEIVAYATGNKVLGKIVLDARTNVERGEPLSAALNKSRAYPRLLIHMLTAGEKTGRVDEMLAKIADFYNDEVETTLAGLTSLIEPLLIVFLGVIIGGVVVCMFMPIFKMHEIVGF